MELNMLEIQKTKHNDVTVMRCAGSLDLDGAGELKKCMNDSRSEGNFKMVLNFAEVKNIQSSVLQQLVTPIRANTAIGGAIIFCHLSEPNHKTLKTAMFYPICKVFDTEEEALGWLQEKS